MNLFADITDHELWTLNTAALANGWDEAALDSGEELMRCTDTTSEGIAFSNYMCSRRMFENHRDYPDIVA